MSGLILKIEKTNEITYEFVENDVIKFKALLQSNDQISTLLQYDVCFRIADNYLLAMVFMYFKQAGLKPEEYTSTVFFAALWLAHDMVEEDGNKILELLHFAIPDYANAEYRKLTSLLKTVKCSLFLSMESKGFVTREACEEVIKILGPPICNRQRDIVHGGAAAGVREGITDVEENWFTNTCLKCRSVSVLRADDQILTDNMINRSDTK